MGMQLPDFSSVRLLVAGDLMLDRYWQGSTARISPEAPVPVVRVEQTEDRPGGAANVALNLAALGARVELVGVTGCDEDGRLLEERLLEKRVDCRFHRDPRVQTITKLRVISRHQQLIRLDFEQDLYSLELRAMEEACLAALPECQALVLSDYAKGTLQNPSQLIEAARRAGIPVLVDPKGREFSRYRGATLLTPNLAEFEQVAGPCGSDSELARKGNDMCQELGLEALLITLGERGMLLLQKGAPLCIYRPKPRMCMT